MKRDMELIRKLLLYIEENEKPMSGGLIGIKVNGYSNEVIYEHLRLMDGKGFFVEFKVFMGGSHSVRGLTNEAYDYLELTRNDEVW